MKNTTLKKLKSLPFLGFGIGLRPKHYESLLENPQQVDWLEIISENFMFDSGPTLEKLDEFKEKFTIIPHGVSLSIGSSDPLNFDYLKKLKKLIERLDPPWFSDHLCWTSYKKQNLHNLMPLPYTPETANYVAERIKIVQDFIEKPLLIENVSSYVEFNQSTMPEWEFIGQISEKANCGLILDVNNVFVSAFNHQFDPLTYINAIPPERVIQYHIAGHSDHETYIVDTHDHDVREEVWTLFEKTVPRFGQVSVMIERDDNIPPLDEVLEELNIAKEIWKSAHA